MNPLDLINRYYPEENELKSILLIHSRKVAEKALAIAKAHPEFLPAVSPVQQEEQS